MDAEILLLIRVVVICIVVVLTIGFSWNIWRHWRAENEDYDKYRRSALDEGVRLSPESEDDFLNGNVAMRQRTSRLNPAFLGIRQPHEVEEKTADSHRSDATDEPNMVLPYSIMAPYNRRFTGADVAKLVRHFDLKRSPNDTFELVNEDGSILFTMINVRQPGVFPKDLTQLVSLEGVLLILQLPSGSDPMASWQNFNAMAHDMAHCIDGSLCDHKRRPLSHQSKQKYRQAVEAFSVKYWQWQKVH